MLTKCKQLLDIIQLIESSYSGFKVVTDIFQTQFMSTF